MGRLDEITDEDLAHYAETERSRVLSRAESFISGMTMTDVWEFFGDLPLKHQCRLMEAIRDHDDMEVGSCFMDALRDYAKDATT